MYLGFEYKLSLGANANKNSYGLPVDKVLDQE